MTTRGPQSRELTEDDEITEVFGEVDANLSMTQLIVGVLVANLVTAAIVGLVVLVITSL